MKTYVDLSWIRGRAKAVLLFDTENTIISDLDSLMSKTLIVPASNKERYEH